jgi:flagellar biosynthetic protein FliQ
VTTDGAVDLFAAALFVAVKVAGPMLLATLLIGLVVGVLQAATQVNEGSIAFVAKLLVVTAVFIITGPWAVRQLMDYTTRTIASIADVVR